MAGPKTKISKEFRSLLRALGFPQTRARNMVIMLQDKKRQKLPEVDLGDVYPSEPFIDPSFRPQQEGQPIIAPFGQSGMRYVPIWSEAVPDSGRKVYAAETMGMVERPEGKRFYVGRGSDLDPDRAIDFSELGAVSKILSNPADSLRGSQVRGRYEGMTSEDLARAYRALQSNPDYIERVKF